MSDGASSRATLRRGTGLASPRLDELQMTEPVFKLFQTVIHRNAGIFLAEHKRALLTRRLRGRVRTLGLPSFLAYYRLVTDAPDEGELRHMLDLVSTNETRFFREPRQLEVLERELLPALRDRAERQRRTPRLRAWCAACSSGEEPFTLAMILSRRLPANWRIEILATDLSSRMLERARGAVWPARQLGDIPPGYASEFMLRHRGAHGETIEAKPALRRLVRFDRLNLHVDAPPPGPFDLVLCRNVLMYFDRSAKRQAIDRLLSVLADHGYLLVGHAESLSGLDPRLRLVAPTIYDRIERAPAARPAEETERGR